MVDEGVKNPKYTFTAFALAFGWESHYLCLGDGNDVKGVHNDQMNNIVKTGSYKITRLSVIIGCKTAAPKITITK